MNKDALIKPLGIDEVDFRVQSVNNGGYATILAYKDARADMIRLDAAVGPLGWKREHTNGNANCTVSLWDSETKQWVSKEDTGSESNAEANKGLASDSFKRACFNWGIGRELYDYPTISVKLFEDEITERNGRKTANWNLKLKEWTWFSQFKDGKITYLAAKDQNGKKRFVWGEYDKELQEQTAKGVQSDSSPTEDPTSRGTTDEEENGNTAALTKKVAGPIERPEKPETPTEEQEVKEPTAEEVKWNELAQKYAIMFGKKPRANTKLETLEQKIAEETARREAEQSTFDGTASDTQGAVYSASGEEAEEEVEESTEESEEESSEDPYSEDQTTMTEEQLEEAEEPEEVEVEEVSLLDKYTNEIKNHKDRTKFVEWARVAVGALTGHVSEEEITTFKATCQKHYESIG